MDYIVICEWPLKSFNTTINTFLDEGWSLYGNPFTIKEWGHEKMCQALITTDAPPDQDQP